MAKPRMAKSVRIAELNLDAERIPGQARNTIPGTVDKIIASRGPTQPEKAQIAVAGADERNHGVSHAPQLLDVDDRLSFGATEPFSWLDVEKSHEGGQLSVSSC